VRRYGGIAAIAVVMVAFTFVLLVSLAIGG
jgi:hypothetical protein